MHPMVYANPVHIFLVEDDHKLSGAIKYYLEKHHFSVSTEKDGNLAVERILDEKPALVILDIMLPGKDGKTICRELRGQYDGLIVMLTALGEEVDQIVGLEIGADDYIAKPVRPRFLLCRINALLRLTARFDIMSMEKPATDVDPNAADTMCIGDLKIHLPSRSVFLNRRPIELSTVQFDLLTYLATHAGRVISREQLYKDLRGIDYDGLNRSIDLAIARIRRKLSDDGNHPRIIKSVRGEGYLMVKPS